jgi:GH35 family endo-1,4-beta-xylanase
MNWNLLFFILLSFGRSNGQSFRELAPPGLYVGSVLHGYGNSWNEPDYQKIALDNFNIITSTIYLPYVWKSLNETINTEPFKNVIRLLSQKNILVHGHVLLYPSISTESNWWMKQSMKQVKRNVNTYIKAIVSAAGKGTVYSWDVVNEVMGDDNDDMDADGVRRKMWNGKAIIEYKAMGQNYISHAFKIAHSLDPTAKLLITDYGTEYDTIENENEKSDRLYRFVQKLLNQGTPIHGIGFQMHLSSDDGHPDYFAIVRNFQRFRNLGMKIYITEMDVISYRTKELDTGSPNAALERAAGFQGRVYRRILEICLEEPACISFRFWDFAEYNSRLPNLRYSWLHPITHLKDQNGVYTYPTPFADINPASLQPKPAWNAMRNAMSDFMENEGATYRITSRWETQTSYLALDGIPTNDGTFLPSNQVHLQELNVDSQQWSSFKWRLERVVGFTNIYRIQCLWGLGYLTRVADQDNSGAIFPSGNMIVTNFNVDWKSQEWKIEYYLNETFKISSNWQKGGEDFVTRLGEPIGNGNYKPTNEINIQSDESYTSQQWYLQRTW